MKEKIPTTLPDRDIPTIPPEFEFTDSIQRHPTKAEVKEVFDRIQQTKDLSQELKRIDVKLGGLSHLIALTIHQKKYGKSLIT